MKKLAAIGRQALDVLLDTIITTALLAIIYFTGHAIWKLFHTR